MTVLFLLHWVFRSWISIPLCLCVIYGIICLFRWMFFVTILWKYMGVQTLVSFRGILRRLLLEQNCMKVKIKIRATSAYFWALNQWSVLESLTSNPQNSHVKHCYHPPSFCSWSSLGICPRSHRLYIAESSLYAGLFLNPLPFLLRYFVVHITQEVSFGSKTWTKWGSIKHWENHWGQSWKN